MENQINNIVSKLIKVSAQNSNYHVMFFDEKSNKSNDLINLDIFKNNFSKIKPNMLSKLNNDIRRKIYSLIKSGNFIEKTNGNCIIIDKEYYYLDVKSYDIDRRIQRLYSLYKIAVYCEKNNVNLLVERPPASARL